jgi:nucleotide-binding universal stress UspA family protein
LTPKDEAAEGEHGSHRIVVGVDGSPDSIKALGWAARHAELTGWALEIVMAWEWPTSFGWSPMPSGLDPEAEMKKTLKPILSSLRTEHPTVVVEGKIVESRPVPALLEQSRGAELLVVGSRGHGEFVGMLIGSTSEHCVTNAECTVVVVRGPD